MGILFTRNYKGREWEYASSEPAQKLNGLRFRSPFRGKVMIYSYRNASTGLAVAALIDLNAMVNPVTRMPAIRDQRKYNQRSSILQSKFCSLRCIR